MPTKNMNPVEEHFEKGILGIAALVLLYTLFAFTFSSPTSVTIGNDTAGPGQAYKLVLQKAEEIPSKAQEQAARWPAPKIPKVTEEQGLVLTGLPESLKKPLSPIVAIYPEAVEPPGTEITRKKYDIPKVLPVIKVAAFTGRSTIDLASNEKLQEVLQDSGKVAEKSWVTVYGQIDLVGQRKQMDLPEKLPDFIEKEPVFFRVDLQRSQLGADGKWGSWEPVPCILDSKGLLVAPDEPMTVETITDLTKKRGVLYGNLGAVEGYALTPDFPSVEAGDEWKDPSQPAEEKKTTKPEREPTERAVRPPVRRGAQQMPGGGGPGGPGMPGGGGGRGAGGNMMMPGGQGGAGGAAKRSSKAALDLSQKKKGGVGAVGGMQGPGMEGPGMMPPGMGPVPGGMVPGGYGAAVPGMRGQAGLTGRTSGSETRVTKLTDEERKKQKVLWVWVHDFTAKPGKTYKYQMKVFMYNPLAGYKPILKTPEKTLVVGLSSPWSKASEPVTAVSEYYVFLSSPGDGNKTANLLVYKWHNGWLYKENFEAKPGQTIGAKKKVAKIYRKTPEGIVQEPAQEIDFNTGVILQDIQGNVPVTVKEAGGTTRQETAAVVTLKMPDGTIVKQDTSNINGDKDAVQCKRKITAQLQSLRAGPIIRADQPAKEASE